MLILRALAVRLFLIVAEIIQGTLRTLFAARVLGDHRARQVGVFTGGLIVLLIADLSIGWVGPVSTADALLVGGCGSS